MAATLFPFVWLGGPNADPNAPQRVKDFRPRPVSVDAVIPLQRMPVEEPVEEDPKVSSATDGAGGSGSGSQTSLKGDEGNSVDAAKGQMNPLLNSSGVAPTPTTLGSSLLLAQG